MKGGGRLVKGGGRVMKCGKGWGNGDGCRGEGLGRMVTGGLRRVADSWERSA